MLLWARRRGMFNLQLLDMNAPSLAMGYAVGRVGCQISGDGDYGSPTDLPWGMAYPDGVVPTDEVVHPTPIYETLAMGLGAWVLWTLRDRLRPGVLFAFYLTLVGGERLLVEFVRRNEPVLLGLTEAQLASLVVLAARDRLDRARRPHGRPAGGHRAPRDARYGLRRAGGDVRRSPAVGGASAAGFDELGLELAHAHVELHHDAFEADLAAGLRAPASRSRRPSPVSQPQPAAVDSPASKPAAVPHEQGIYITSSFVVRFMDPGRRRDIRRNLRGRSTRAPSTRLLPAR